MKIENFHEYSTEELIKAAYSKQLERVDMEYIILELAQRLEGERRLTKQLMSQLNKF